MEPVAPSAIETLHRLATAQLVGGTWEHGLGASVRELVGPLRLVLDDGGVSVQLQDEQEPLDLVVLVWREGMSVDVVRAALEDAAVHLAALSSAVDEARKGLEVRCGG